ncbi:eCIS core domain-containing protein [Streptomyces sp. NPDC001492]
MNDQGTAEERPPPDEERPTLGQLLDARARHRARTVQAHLAWARPLAAVMRKAEQLGGVVGDRFDRFEGRPFAYPGASAPTAAALVRRPPTAPRHVDIGEVTTGEHPRGTDATASWKSPSRQGSSQPASVDGAGADAELRELPPSTRYRLRQEVGAAADALRVHDGPHADALARAADADAVAVGREVHLRQGRYAPHRQDGLALLAHEATHVAAVLEPGHAWRRAVGDDAEETTARTIEARLLGGTSHPPSRPSAPAPPGRSLTPSAAPPADTSAATPAPRAAHTDRDLTASPAEPVDLDALRRSVLADVMRQIRTESERGG